MITIRCELVNDPGRGPGHGLIRIGGLEQTAGRLEFCLERNQGSAPFLGPDGTWQAQEFWHGVGSEAGSDSAVAGTHPQPFSQGEKGADPSSFSTVREMAAEARSSHPFPSGTKPPGAVLVEQSSPEGFRAGWPENEKWPEGPDEGEKPHGADTPSMGKGTLQSIPRQIPVGPEIVDPIVSQPPSVVFRLTLSADGARYPCVLRIQRPLLGSGAYFEAKPAPAPQAEPESVPEPVPVPEPEPIPAPAPSPEPVPPPVPRPSRGLWLGFALLLALAGAGAWAWWDCRIPALPGPQCQTATPKTEQNAEAQPVSPPQHCTGLSTEDCLAAAQKSLAARQPDAARQLFQEAAELGAPKAYIELGRMYDPDTWSAETSPAANADWETAAYWYDEAARTGDRDGRLGAGRLYCRNTQDPAFLSHALELLRKAVAEAPGDAAAEAVLKECEEKAK
ncbi:tetratricopeptide repeat protein [Methylococcus capsulatus]|uniref:tetratricopeptide repeat protein n=1 Tax=Methylococcus capsulatus TaxID=414 RepID=UPI001C5274AB|nr:hypothetical protein [Methylococcus capsulatus]QXP87510.1 hypothetical protein KW112_14335 [Methylococcus capsulatus]QXP92750.1 hypothetical protein KW113_10175 [Methylococcus capsulatus]UQN12521.1 hypothetical protein M3M30_01315 [Methylococcus capsulatus]